MRDSIFISYAHEDMDWAKRFEKMLNGQRNDVRVFRDHEIAIGEDWESRLRAEVARTRIALVLASPDFFDSEYITGRELPWILQERTRGLTVWWVEIEPSIAPADIAADLHRLQASKIQSSDRSLSQLRTGDQDAEIKSICERMLAEMSRHAREPRWEFRNNVSDVVHRRFGYSIWREVAIGDHSVVYTADAPGSRVVVKAQVQQLLRDDETGDLSDLSDELTAAKALTHPAFMRVLDWSFDTDPRIIVSEFVRARPLHQILAGHPDGLPVEHARFVTQTIATALHEYHEAGLTYTNIRPSDVLITKRRDGDWYPRISAFRAAQISLKGELLRQTFRTDSERLTYLAPEQYRGETHATQKTDQYTLGLLAVEMLQGKPPVQVRHLVDLEEKTEFFADPEAYGGPWMHRSPELTDVVLRMLHPDAEKRWKTMGAIAEALGGQATVAENNRRLAKQSYLRLVDRGDAFLATFYEELFADRDDLRATFPDDHDWQRQHRMLGAALRSLLNFAPEHATNEPTLLTETAAVHRGLALPPAAYDAFQAAFLETLAAFGEGSEEIVGAWKACFAPGIAYMKRHGAVRSRGPDAGARTRKATSARKGSSAKSAGATKAAAAPSRKRKASGKPKATAKTKSGSAAAAKRKGSAKKR